MATNGRNRRLEPAYIQHTAVAPCVIVDVEVCTGEENEGGVVAGRLDAVAATNGHSVRIATMDAGYVYAKVFRALEDRVIKGVVPAKTEPRPSKVIPTRRFKFDVRHNLARCPRGKILRPKGKKLHLGAFQNFHDSAIDCRSCPLRASCVSLSRHAHVVVFKVNHPSLLRARRKRIGWSNHEQWLYRCHRWRFEGVHSEAKTWHGLARAVHRGLQYMRIQAFLTAAAINVKRLAAALATILLVSFVPPGANCGVERPNSA